MGDTDSGGKFWTREAADGSVREQVLGLMERIRGSGAPSSNRISALGYFLREVVFLLLLSFSRCEGRVSQMPGREAMRDGMVLISVRGCWCGREAQHHNSPPCTTIAVQCLAAVQS